MDLGIKDQSFLICGCTAGFGLATAEALMKDGAKVIGVARTQEGLDQLKSKYKKLFHNHQD